MILSRTSDGSQAEEVSTNTPVPVAPEPPEPLADIYQRYFHYRIARTKAEQNQAFRLRYEVYCQETAFLPADAHPDGLESDEHDAHSLHGLLYYRPTLAVAGAVRVILPQAGEEGFGLPARLFAPALAQAALPPQSTGEISRFAIAPHFRKRSEDGLYAALLDPRQPDPRRVIPHITLGLMTAIFDMVIQAKLTHLCAIIDPALLRLLRRLGINFVTQGPLVEFHGKRQPVWAEGRALLAGVEALHPGIAEVISGKSRFSVDHIAHF